jgi:hypothetical protein
MFYLPFEAEASLLLCLHEPLFSHRGAALQIAKTLTTSAILARLGSS